MYPNTFFNLFPAFPLTNRAFVAMSFNTSFDARWNSVLKPGLSRIRVNGDPIDPHRVDLTIASDSILTGILDDIARARLIVADISTIAQLDGRPFRNANVFYEVGLAHATRLPEEVVLFRSDEDNLAFDISNVRVHRYDPDGDPDGAQKFVTETVLNSLRELDLKRNLAVRRAAEALSYESWDILGEAIEKGVTPPALNNMGQVLSAAPRLDGISRLLDIGAIRTQFIKLTPETLKDKGHLGEQNVVTYVPTPFGHAIFNRVVDDIGVSDPARREEVRRLLASE